jgi:hypothetical protein
VCGLLLASLAGALAACRREPPPGTHRNWAAERVCLPCHSYRLPIAHNHNYRCDTCHAGQPYAKDKSAAHRDLIVHPQEAAVVGRTCQKCHLKMLGTQESFDADFVKDLLTSHGDYAPRR